MNYRNEIIKQINELDKKNNRIVDLAKGQLELLDQTKASKEAYKDFYQDIKDLSTTIPENLNKNKEQESTIPNFLEELRKIKKWELTPIENTPKSEQQKNDIQTSLDNYAENHKSELKQDQAQERGRECNQLLK